MTENVTLLREFVRCALLEKAKSTKDAQSAGLALYVFNSGVETKLGLYDPTTVIELIQKQIDATLLKHQKKVAREDFDINVYFKGIPQLAPAFYAMIEFEKGTEPAYNAKAITGSAAESGWGPLIYDIAIALSKTGLMPDRSSVSPEAASVWKYYDKNRKDVTSLPLDNIDDPKTKTKKDDSTVFDDASQPEIDKVYKFKTAGPNISKLIACHNECMNSIIKLMKKYKLEDYDKSDLNDCFELGIMEFFLGKFKS